MGPDNDKNDIENVEHAPHGSQPSSRTASVRHEHNEIVGETEFSENRKGLPFRSYDKIRNPLSGISKPQLMSDVESFAREKDLMDSLSELQKGALIAQDPTRFEALEDLTEEDKIILRQETTHRWHQPRTLYYMTSVFLHLTEDAANNYNSSLRWFCYRARHGSNGSQWGAGVLLR